MRRIPFFPMFITVLISIGGYLGCQPPQQIAQQVEQQIGNQIGNEIGHVVERAQNSGLLPPTNGMQGNQGMPGYQPGMPGYQQGTTGYQGTGGYLGQGVPGVPVSTGRNAPLTNTQLMQMPQRTNSNLIIGSFNVQRLGPKKIEDASVMQYLANIIQRFDVIAIQEVTSKDPKTVPTLLNYVNAQGARYSYTISSPVGRSTYLEQYAFIYDTARVTTSQEACFVMPDQEDLLHREPFVGHFATRAPNPFTFALINMHTDPDLVDTELNTLANVYVNVSNYYAYRFQPPEDDVILMGDMNADPAHFRNLAQIPNVVPSIVGIPTMTKGANTNDNILINRTTTHEFTGRAGALNLQALFQLQQSQALLLSDHIPVWAEFNIQEASNSQLATPGNVSWMR